MREILINYIKRYMDASDERVKEIVDDVTIFEYKKGTILVNQGDLSDKCYFVLKGCVRQYSINEEGKETTFNFFTEEQVVDMLNTHLENKESLYTFECLEDSVLVVGDSDVSDMMATEHADINVMTRRVTEENMSKLHEEYTAFIALNPEERYKRLLLKRPDLPNRVPQYQLASYLGMTPESLSRIKKRIKKAD